MVDPRWADHPPSRLSDSNSDHNLIPLYQPPFLVWIRFVLGPFLLSTRPGWTNPSFNWQLFTLNQKVTVLFRIPTGCLPQVLGHLAGPRKPVSQQDGLGERRRRVELGMHHCTLLLCSAPRCCWREFPHGPTTTWCACWLLATCRSKFAIFSTQFFLNFLRLWLFQIVSLYQLSVHYYRNCWALTPKLGFPCPL